MKLPLKRWLWNNTEPIYYVLVLCINRMIICLKIFSEYMAYYRAMKTLQQNEDKNQPFLN